MGHDADNEMKPELSESVLEPPQTAEVVIEMFFVDLARIAGAVSAQRNSG